jgi:hypothetical protein
MIERLANNPLITAGVVFHNGLIDNGDGTLTLYYAETEEL